MSLRDTRPASLSEPMTVGGMPVASNLSSTGSVVDPGTQEGLAMRGMLKTRLASLMAALAVPLITVQSAIAQTDPQAGTSTTTSSSSTSTVWYTQWWIWAVGVAVFLIVVIALTNRGGTSRTP